MNLVLASQATTHNARLAISQLLNTQTSSIPTVGYIASAPDPQREYFNATQQLYTALNAQMCVYLELESEFSSQTLTALFACDVIHLSGGDTERFLTAIKQRQLIEPLTTFAHHGGAIVGVSAGAMLLTPSIVSATLCGDNITGDNAQLEALNLVPFQFVPHFKSQQLSNRQFNQQLKTLQTNVYLCGDNDAIAIEQHKVLLYGSPQLHQHIEQSHTYIKDC
ncbi:Type 1 glutamine amidotransferase-like domain-containing protein [Shewanella youngdeokensis]|uniref:Type 1 glutamine amidotransferase-like domain-containing protein n=1 Tax=Shewanella youngdeokensis TaxID=2999068 RepID=A0ABZ0K326_9GAMM|nr:Type 1 glutamine amidotransferase-like domain-containing protein [Shewanella sp. DAU334]